MMGAGNASSTLYNSSPNLNTGGGSKKQGITSRIGLNSWSNREVQTNSNGIGRFRLFYVNQMGGIGHRINGGGGIHFTAPTPEPVKPPVREFNTLKIIYNPQGAHTLTLTNTGDFNEMTVSDIDLTTYSFFNVIPNRLFDTTLLEINPSELFFRNTNISPDISSPGTIKVNVEYSNTSITSYRLNEVEQSQMTMNVTNTGYFVIISFTPIPFSIISLKSDRYSASGQPVALCDSILVGRLEEEGRNLYVYKPNITLLNYPIFPPIYCNLSIISPIPPPLPRPLPRPLSL
jgi:hypothetical protein